MNWHLGHAQSRTDSSSQSVYSVYASLSSFSSSPWSPPVEPWNHCAAECPSCPCAKSQQPTVKGLKGPLCIPMGPCWSVPTDLAYSINLPLNPLTHKQVRGGNCRQKCRPGGNCPGDPWLYAVKIQRGNNLSFKLSTCSVSWDIITPQGILLLSADFSCLFHLVSIWFLFSNDVLLAQSLSLSPLLHFAPPYGFGFRHDMVISMLKRI